MNRIFIEYESEIYFVYDSDEKALLTHTSDVKMLTEWIENNLEDTRIGAPYRNS
jgi:hypothetical protein